MFPIEAIYELHCKASSDISEHLPILFDYAKKCESITEFGVRQAVSTWAFLAAKPKIFHCYDIVNLFQPEIVKEICESEGIRFEFHLESTLECDIIETDLLFIDTYHHYNQLIQELRRHESKAKKYIIMHDTLTFGENSQDGNDGMGLNRAIYEFLTENKNWEMEKIYISQNGLTILRRVDESR